MALNKHFFVGGSLSNPSQTIEFYSNNFVVDASVSNGMVPVGTYDDVDRVHWEIQEGVLLVRKSYDYVTGADGRRATGRANNGLVVAAYRITDHFDIRSDYNPTTGEPSNVMVENRSGPPLVPARLHARRLVAEPRRQPRLVGAVLLGRSSATCRSSRCATR